MSVTNTMFKVATHLSTKSFSTLIMMQQ